MRCLNRLPALSLVLASALCLALAGCQSAGPAAATAPARSPDAPPVTCKMTCNSEYDSCMDRFSGVIGRGTSSPQTAEDPASNLGPNDVCPDQLKSCLRRCLY